MNNLRLINFRNIEDSSPIEIKPLTFFVGKNGAGKSSVLRLFPLLKQSFSEPKRGPLLWYTENGVDFGDFKTTVMKGKNTMGIGFDVLVGQRDNITINVLINIEAEHGDDQYDYVSSMQLNYDDVMIQIDFHHEKAVVFVNGEKVDNLIYYVQPYNLFPSVFSNEREDDAKLLDEVLPVINESNRSTYRGPYDLKYISFKEFSKKLEGKEIRFNLKKLFARIVCMNIMDILMDIYMVLNNELNSLTYIGPFRNSPQRYYRVQNKSTNMIDMYGSNMAGFVKAMSKNELMELNKILKPKYDFELAYESKFGQISLYIKKGNKKTNLIDNGYGYSQLMPILLAMNHFTHRRMLPNQYTEFLCVEQPELHLHPKMQSIFGTSLADAVIINRNTHQRNKCMIIETHSKQIIEAVGKSIYEKKVNSDDVAVYLFDQGKDKRAIIKKVSFNSEGYLDNWPMGFLG